MPTLATCLTPPGKGAIATLALRGPRAEAVARALFRFPSGGSLQGPLEAGRFWLGRFGEGTRDEVVLAVKQTVPVPWLEIHCHGGPEVVRLLLEALSANGVQSCSWQAFSRATEPDALRSAAAAELAKAPTVRTAAILLDQYQGAFSAALDAILAAVDAGALSRAGELLEDLVHHAPLGRHLSEPWRVAVLGPPNVGKSSLVNALAGFQRSVVAPTPGTTRDVVTTRIAVDGWPVELADTAGLRDVAGTLEAAGIERAHAAAGAADLCLWLLDASAPPTWPAAPLPRFYCLINKIDVPAVWDLATAPAAVRVSALVGTGLPQLCQALADWLVPNPPVTGAPVPFTPSLAAAIEEAYRHWQAGRVEEARQWLNETRTFSLSTSTVN